MNGDEIKALRDLEKEFAKMSGWMDEHNRGAQERSQAVVSVMESCKDMIDKQSKVIEIQTNEIANINVRCGSRGAEHEAFKAHIKEEKSNKKTKSDRTYEVVLGCIMTVYTIFVYWLFGIKK